MLYRTLGNESGALRVIANYAELLHETGQTAAAIAVVRDAVERSSGDRELHGVLHNNLSAYYGSAGDVTNAKAAGARAIALLETAGSATGAVAMAIGHLALAHAITGDVERAARLLGYWNASAARMGVRREFTEQTTHDRIVALLADRIDPAQCDVLMYLGAQLDAPAAIAEALVR